MTSEDDQERIARRLSRAGVASRREAERMIAEGRVKVNGRRIDSPALNVGPADVIEADGRLVAAPEPPRLWRYHKPSGLVTTERDEKGRATVFERLPPELPRVMSVGRLDLNSEGLLLLTNDGALKRRLELPSTGWLRKYRVRVHGNPTAATLAPLEKGVVVDGERFQPMSVTVDRQQGANAWLTIGLREGRNREIRRALEAVGLEVNRLIRISYGPFQLGDLTPGAVEEVRSKVMREQLGLTREDLEPNGAAAAGRAGARPGAGPDRGAAPAAAASRPSRPGAGGGAPAARGSAKFGAKFGAKSGAKSGEADRGPKAGPKPGAKPGAKPGPKSGAKPDAKPGGRSGERSGGTDAAPRGRAPGRPGVKGAPRSGGAGGGSPRKGPGGSRRG